MIHIYKIDDLPRLLDVGFLCVSYIYIYHGYYDDDKTDDLPNIAMETMD